MRYWIQYHNYSEIGRLPAGYIAEKEDLSLMDTSEMEASVVNSKKKSIKESINNVIFLIVGFGKKAPKRYILWSWMVVDEVSEEDGIFEAVGEGKVLNKPPLLFGRDFDEFFKWNNNFSFGFREITKHEYLRNLIELAREFGGFPVEKSDAKLEIPKILLPEEISKPAQLHEGAKKQIIVNSYERNQEAVRRCIAHYGPVCQICDLRMEDRYGIDAKGLIHVHHIKPMKSITEEYEVDPISDLRPVCPNCHAVIHRSDPPFEMNYVKNIIIKD